MRAEIITIGDEILIGQTVDTNSAWMGKELNKRGVSVERIHSIQDTEEAIHSCLNEVLERAELVLLTGGLGPTSDDITKYSIANYFGSELVMNQEALDNIQERFARRGIPMLQINHDQAKVPEDCIPIHNQLGTAPGMLFERPNALVVSMPGVPYEMKDMMLRVVLPRLEQMVQQQHIVHETITVVNIPESVLSDRIKDVEQALPDDIKLAYLPHLNLVRLRLTGRSRTRQSNALRAEIDQHFSTIKQRLGNSYFDGDHRLAEVVGILLKEKGMNMGAVESCTGGFIAHSITRNPGSSAYFKGGMVTYANQLKIDQLNVEEELFTTVGSVSEEVAEQMARNGQKELGVDYCIAVTGIAGPSGATETKEVGLVYIGLASPDGNVMVSKHQFKGSRMQIIERTAFSALERIRQALMGN